MAEYRTTATGRVDSPDLVAVEVVYEVRRVVHVWAFSSPEAVEAARHPEDWADADQPHEMMDTLRIPRDRVLIRA